MKIGKKLRGLRKEKKITLKELSEKSGVQIATLSRIENDIMTGTLESHINICKALDVSLSDFYREVEHDQKSVSVSKRSEKKEAYVRPKESSIEMLTAKVMDKKMMPVLIRIKKGGKTHKEENKPGTEKFIYVFEGKIEAKIGNEEYILSKGDSIYFDASLSHVFRNQAKTDAQALAVLTPPTF